MKGKTIWILVADGARARIFRSNAGGTRIEPALPYELVADKRPSKELISDRPGRTKDRMAHGRHALEPGTDPHVHAQQAFANKLADMLDDGRRAQAFDEVVIIAPPRMLGYIRESMNDHLRKMVRREVPKDLSKLDPNEAQKVLYEYI
jgi:protein required for attachment to host cells